ncbi:porin family protein [Patiriisocius sp. Uisw_047]|jgi:hypothetical protein|uniref:type IX secretion/gliding motility protein PorT/SprT n=1 Tax=Patiriisocius sp. Uisw_047 TaxID=3230969 RepID=UPI0039EB927A
MKRYLFIFAFAILAQSANAQLFSKERVTNLETFDKKLLTWGYFLGFNTYDFNFDYEQDLGPETDVVVNSTGGFNVGLIGDLRINKYVNLRLEPGLYFTQRDLLYRQFEEENDRLRSLQSTYIHVPLLVKFSTKRINNFKPFIVGGVSTSLNLSSNQDNPEDNGEGQFRMKKNTSYFELGFGIDFYLFYFKFTPSIRGVFATSDELVRDENPNSAYTSNIAKMGSRGLFVNFTFQ